MQINPKKVELFRPEGLSMMDMVGLMEGGMSKNAFDANAAKGGLG